MIPFRFPFRWGAPQPPVPEPAPEPPLWTAITADAQNWDKDGPQIQPRFARIMVNQDTGPQFVKVADVVS